MEDSKIIDLYFERNESAINETQDKYGKYLVKVAYNILADIEDSHEAVNDTYLKAWYSIPPNRPAKLSSFLSKITRQVSIDIYRKKSAKKRKGSEYALSIEEFSYCFDDKDRPEKEIDAQIIAKAIGEYLNTLPEDTRNIFICRYYFLDSVRDISNYFGQSQSKTKSILHRVRLGLKDYLQKEELI